MRFLKLSNSIINISHISHIEKISHDFYRINMTSTSVNGYHIFSFGIINPVYRYEDVEKKKILMTLRLFLSL